MATMDLNAQLLREISAIISDRELTEKTLSFVRSLRRQYRRTVAKNGKSEKREEEEETIGKEELMQMLREGLREVKLIKEGKLKGRPAEELLNEL